MPERGRQTGPLPIGPWALLESSTSLRFEAMSTLSPGSFPSPTSRAEPRRGHGAESRI